MYLEINRYEPYNSTFYCLDDAYNTRDGTKRILYYRDIRCELRKEKMVGAL